MTNAPDPTTASPTPDAVLSDDELREIRERADAATPGPWFVDERSKHQPKVCDHNYYIADVRQGESNRTREQASAVAQFIAASRADVPRLLATIARLKSVIAAGAEQAETALEELNSDDPVKQLAGELRIASIADPTMVPLPDGRWRKADPPATPSRTTGGGGRDAADVNGGA